MEEFSSILCLFICVIMLVIFLFIFTKQFGGFLFAFSPYVFEL